MLQSIAECYRVLQSVSEYYKALQSVTECYNVLQGFTGCQRVLKSITKYYKDKSSASTWTNFIILCFGSADVKIYFKKILLLAIGV